MRLARQREARQKGLEATFIVRYVMIIKNGSA